MQRNIETMLRNAKHIEVPDSTFDRVENVLRSLEERKDINSMKPKYRKQTLVAAVVAVFIVVTATTALAYGDEIWQLIFARQVESVDDGLQIHLYDSSDTATIGVSLLNSQFDLNQPSIMQEFTSLDELKQAVAFDLKLPSYMPADIENLHYSYILGSENIENGNIFAINIGYYFNDEKILFDVSQFYLGDEGQLMVETVWPIQWTMVGDNEGLVIHSTYDGEHQAYSGNLSLYWQNNGILYILHAYGATLDLETMIKIAESIE